MAFAQAFTPISASQAEASIQSGSKVVLFIGRSSCPFCRRFEPKLATAAHVIDTKILFLNSGQHDELTAIQSLRSKYNVPTVPGLLVADNGKVKVICDSSLSEEAISAFIS